ncbi:methyltransferase domain-containing protein [candidate division KSB1 bacterium]|nr:methyltransferase domain-containing protein [candidate division KSB1 bacterium]
MSIKKIRIEWVLLVLLYSMIQVASAQPSLDDRVQSFLEKHQSEWNDWNIPMRDGQLLYDLIIEHNYTQALEIGTSTGHSTIWIAWALSKTGGKLVTIEIDKERHEQAVENLKKVGLDRFVDFRLADAHQLVKELKGPFDFVFSDADKSWYKQYFLDIAPKMEPGGCFTAHNIGMRMSGIREFLDTVSNHPEFETTIETDRSTGISISYKQPK